MKKTLRTPSVDQLFAAILNLKTEDECYAFFEDICTIHEIQSLAQRFEVAGMLQKGITYSEIAAKTGASTATISRVNRSINYGEGGYKTVIERLGEEK